MSKIAATDEKAPYLTKYDTLSEAKADAPTLTKTESIERIVIDKGQPKVITEQVESEDTTDAMVVTAWARKPVIETDRDGNEVVIDAGEKAAGTFVLDSRVVAELKGAPLKLPPGVTYLDRIYFGMAEPEPGK